MRWPAEPEWALQGVGQVAHLLKEGSLRPAPEYRDGLLSWCGLTLPKDSMRAQFESRCQSCVRNVAKYASGATEPLPGVITETVTVTVQRRIDQTEGLVKYLERHLRKKTSWVFVLSDPTVAPASTDVEGSE